MFVKCTTGSRKCECGLLGVCFDPDKWCNCDSGHDDWLWDGGEIIEKQYLPGFDSIKLFFYFVTDATAE
jgi:hypothetical protein